MLAFENVTRVFRGGAGVTDLTFAVEPGEVVALIGLNGAGKTTLMRLALEDAASAGRYGARARVPDE